MSKLNKTVFITGGATGIGYETAKVLSLQGWNIVLFGNNLETLEEAKRNLENVECLVDIYQGSVTQKEDLENAMSESVKKYGSLNGLVNCAGISKIQERGITDESAFKELLEVNLTGTYLACMLFGYTFGSENSAIVNIASIRARTGTDSFSPGYAASKAGVINLTKTLALELAPKIRVNAVSPGATYPTELSKVWDQAKREEIASMVPMRRLGSPLDIANVIEFLLSDKSSYVTGHTLDVNGGQWMN